MLYEEGKENGKSEVEGIYIYIEASRVLSVIFRFWETPVWGGKPKGRMIPGESESASELPWVQSQWTNTGFSSTYTASNGCLPVSLSLVQDIRRCTPDSESLCTRDNLEGLLYSAYRLMTQNSKRISDACFYSFRLKLRTFLSQFSRDLFPPFFFFFFFFFFKSQKLLLFPFFSLFFFFHIIESNSNWKISNRNI